MSGPTDSTRRIHGRGTDGRLSITAHEGWNFDDGGFMSLYGKDHPGYSQRGVYIRAEPDSGGIELVGDVKITGDGELTFDGKTSNQVVCKSTLMDFDFDNGGQPRAFRYGRFTATAASMFSQWMKGDGTTTRAMQLDHITGSLTTTTGSLGAISDLKLKEDVADATPKLDEILALRVVNYRLKGNPEAGKALGFIAQEVEEIFPGLVHDIEELDEETGAVTDTSKALKLTPMIPMLVKALQEMHGQLQETNARLAALEKKVSTRSRKSSSP